MMESCGLKIKTFKASDLTDKKEMQKESETKMHYKVTIPKLNFMKMCQNKLFSILSNLSKWSKYIKIV